MALGLVAGCDRGKQAPGEAWPPTNLAAFKLFDGDGSTQQPAEGVIPYDLNTPLFTDYAAKHRFVRLPPGQSAVYDPDKAFEFPVGTIIAKTFTMPADLRDPDSPERLLETRLLVHREEGWVGLPYIWNQRQNKAVLKPTGGEVKVKWIDAAGAEQSSRYMVPNMNQCKTCHKEQGPMGPIGPKARHLNRSFAYAHGEENQLAYWSRVGALVGAPDPDAAPRNAVWNDPDSGSVNDRARAWLEINCSHCHNPRGSAQNAGLDLRVSQQEPAKLGVLKTPTAAGRGAGSLSYDIVPGKPDQSIAVYRIESTDPQVMMPELGRRLAHKEGAALVRQWIQEMEGSQF